MDPDDLALIDQYLGRRGQPAQDQPRDPGQDLADALQQYSTAQGWGPLGSRLSPEAHQRAQDFADGLRQYALQNSLPGQPIVPDFTVAAPGGAGAGTGLPGAQPWGSPPDPPIGTVYLADHADVHQPPGGANTPFLPSLAPTLQPPLPPQSPSLGLQGAAADELQKRLVDPNADYYPSENDALANLARGRAAPSWDHVPTLNVPPSVTTGIPPLPGPTIGSHGYRPAAGDENTLARLIFAEGGDTSDDFPAVGWSIVNRVGVREFGKTMNDVRDKDNGFQSVEKGGGPIGGSRQWQLSGEPSKMDPISAKAWRHAQEAAHGILTGVIQDPTGGAQYFFSSSDVDGDAVKASRTLPSQWFYNRFRQGNLRPAQYQGHIGRDAKGPRRNYFAIEPPE